jgi:hypothetical protein
MLTNWLKRLKTYSMDSTENAWMFYMEMIQAI